MYVRHTDEIEATEVAAGQGTSMQVLIAAEEGPNFSMRRFVMQPGGGMPNHTNLVEHEQFVLGAIFLDVTDVGVRPGG